MLSFDTMGQFRSPAILGSCDRCGLYTPIIEGMVAGYSKPILLTDALSHFLSSVFVGIESCTPEAQNVVGY